MKWFIHDKDLMSGGGYGCVPYTPGNLKKYKGSIIFSFDAENTAEAIARLYLFEQMRGKRCQLSKSLASRDKISCPTKTEKSSLENIPL